MHDAPFIWHLAHKRMLSFFGRYWGNNGHGSEWYLLPLLTLSDIAGHFMLQSRNRFQPLPKHSYESHDATS